MRALVTGSMGFIGNAIFWRLLDKGIPTIGIDNGRWSTYRRASNDLNLDIRDPEIEKVIAGVDVVFHLAAQISIDYSIQHPLDNIAINVDGTVNVLEACRKHDVRCLIASSSEVYGSAQLAHCREWPLGHTAEESWHQMPESHPLDPQSPYAASKIAAERMAFAYHKTYGLETVIIRPFNCYGEGQRDDSYGGVIAKFVTAALADEPLTIYGTGDQSRDYTFIEDEVDGWIAAAEKAPPGVPINLAAGRAVTVNRIAEDVVRLTKSGSKIVHTPARPGEVQYLCGDARRAREVLGWEPKHSFEDGLKKIIERRILNATV